MFSALTKVIIVKKKDSHELNQTKTFYLSHLNFFFFTINSKGTAHSQNSNDNVSDCEVKVRALCFHIRVFTSVV